MDKVVATILVLFGAFFIQYLYQLYRIPSLEAILENIGAPEDLTEHSKEFEKQHVVKVTDGVYVAVNYALGNSIMLVGPDGVVIVDTTERVESAEKIAVEFRKITTKPVKGIVYTHHHTDHIHGSKAFIEDGQELPEIWAHHLFLSEEERTSRMGMALYTRAGYQFGTNLQHLNLSTGIGAKLKFQVGETYRLSPTHFVKGDMDITLAGIRMRMIEIPGETADQMGVWLSDKRVLLAADNIYKAFPNLYAIRGTAPRDVNDWANSMDKMRKLKPLHLVGSHGPPVTGEDEIYTILSNYMYGIQYVHDQTVRYINKGMHPDEIVRKVKLPDELGNLPHLKQFYGTVAWSVKGIYESYLGWFSMDPVELNPLTPSERSKNFLDLVGKKNMLRAAQSALRDKDYQWALELASHVNRMEPADSLALDIRRDAMAELAGKEISPNGRNFYMTTMLNDAKKIKPGNIRIASLLVPLDVIFTSMRMRLKAEDLSPGEHLVGCFHFTDTDQTRCCEIHKGIMEISNEEPQDYYFKLTTTETVWREIVAGVRSPLTSYMTGAFSVNGGILRFRNFMKYIDGI